MKYDSWLLALVLLTGLLSCNEKTTEQNEPLYDLHNSFGSYWYQGEAELTSYDLKQARYGQIRDGHAVLVFVTEPFSRSKQVKLDRPKQADESDKQTVMKCNFTKKFNTGIYPYSTMASIFSPIENAEDLHAVKETFSAQEWCGQTFFQLNKKDGQYQWKGFSYFESEGDQNGSFETTWLEDELWNLIRLQPGQLPADTVQMVPSLEFIRLNHAETKPYRAIIDLEREGEIKKYSIEYPALERTLTIRFQSIFPHEIEGWTERRPSGFGEDRQMMTTTATKNRRLTLDYWNHNRIQDTVLRTKLGLNPRP